MIWEKYVYKTRSKKDVRTLFGNDALLSSELILTAAFISS